MRRGDLLFPQDEFDLDRLSGVAAWRVGVPKPAMHASLREYYFGDGTQDTNVARALRAGLPGYIQDAA